MFKNFIYLLFLLFISDISAQSDKKLAEPWISYPTANTLNYGVYHFRRTFSLEQIPEKLEVHLSADNRYEFFVNGQRICLGPAKGDLITYKYDIIDLAPFLIQGKNILAALVFNMGQDKPMAFISAQTAFLMRSTEESFRFLDTGTEWKCYQNTAYDPIMYSELKHWEWVKGYYACGPGDEIFADKYPWGWQRVDFKDDDWKNAEILNFEGKKPWNLVPRNIALMDHHSEHPMAVRRITGMDPTINSNDIFPISIPAKTTAKILLDFRDFTMGYPELSVKGAPGSSVKIRYAEALYEEPNLKAHRDSVNGLTMYGVFDIYHCDGIERTFRPLWKRAFRYVELEITSGDEPFEVVSLQNIYSGYPYPDMASFYSSDTRLNEIFDMGLRTLRMCSGETFYDTPYYEQLCYPGDNRPIMVNYLYNTTDDRLLREVIRLAPQSKNRETKLFKSAYPSRFDFDMGTWSMAWIQGLWDYYEIRGDIDFIKQFNEDINGVLNFHLQHLDESMYLLGPIDTRNFIDWSIHIGSLPQRRPNISITHSAMLSLYYALTLDSAIKIFRATGHFEEAQTWEKLSGKIKESVKKYCWDEEHQLFSEYPGRPEFTQHTNILAILCDVIKEPEQQKLLDNILNYPEFSEVASSYFSFFLFKAMEKQNQDELFVEHLDFWHTFIERGHTTCGETGFASHDRSDCHAWSAHPSHFILSMICGVRPADIGFKSVLIKPHVGKLTEVHANIPHLLGKISIDYRKKEEEWICSVSLPKGLKGIFEWEETKIELDDGLNEFYITNN